MADVVDIRSRKKKSNKEVGPSKQPYSSYLEPTRDQTEDFGSRMERIRASLERINQIMHELKKNSTDYTH